MNLLQTDRTLVEKYAQNFDTAFQNFKSKCFLMQGSANEGKEFYKKFYDYLFQANKEIETFQLFCDEEKRKFVEEHKTVETQTKKDTEFINNSDKYLTTAKDDLSKKRKHMETIKTSMRAAITNLKGKKVAELKVPECPSLLQLFQILFSILYKAEKSEFDWAKFKKNVILKDNSEDFISRAASLDPNEIPKAKLEELNLIKQDEWLKKFVSEDVKGECVLDIIDYLEYIPEYIKAEADIAEIEVNIKNIKRDSLTRKSRNDILKKKVQILEDNYEILQDLEKKVNENQAWVVDLLRQVQERFTELNSYSTKLTKEVQQTYDRELQKVPHSVYE